MKQFTLTINMKDTATYDDLISGLEYVINYMKEWRSGEVLEVNDDAPVSAPDAIEPGKWTIIRELDCDYLAPCAKCGATVPAWNAVYERGTGAEAGKTFTYCGTNCRDTH